MTNHDQLYVAAVTAYDQDGAIDEQQQRALMRYFLDAGPGFGIIVNPEAGEIFYLSPEEQEKLITIAVEEVAGQLPVFSGVLANTTAGTVSAARRALELGADGLFVMPPVGAMDITTAWDPVRYPEVWGDMIAAIADAAGDVPMITHPVAAPSAGYGVGLPVEPTLHLLRTYPQLTGWKMTYNYEGFRKVGRAIRDLDRHVGILGATAVHFHEYLASDMLDGAVTGSFNYALEPMLAHIAAWRSGDVELARKIWSSGLAALHEYVYEQWGRLHVRYKTAAWLRGLIGSPLMRPPMPKPHLDEIRTLRDLLYGAGLPVRDDSSIRAVTDRLPQAPPTLAC
jgi:dihydrodipicolinate synthase/N-acetylneuraminate lyase